MPFHTYVFFDVLPSIQSMSPAKRRAAIAASVAQCNTNTHVRLQVYGTLGFKAGTRFMLHLSSTEARYIQEYIRDFLHTGIGIHLTLPYSYSGMRRASPYNPKGTLSDEPVMKGAYLIVYPFVKTIQWHLLPLPERSRIMKDHVGVGKKYNHNIEQQLLYSYGLDDQEFIVAYATDSLLDFQSLVMELRGTEGRAHTERDTPIFLCTHLSLSEALNLV